MPNPSEKYRYVLGIDLGSHSLGWAVLPLDSNGEPCGITQAGVRTFEAGVEASFDQLMQGKQESKAANRRSKRMPRRQFWRRAWRRYKILKCLITNGLLRDPDVLDIRKPADQDSFLKAIDADLRQRLRPAKDDRRRHLWEQVWPYELRASALERKLDPLELGRALYHLAQRRGFLSNRKTDVTEDDEEKPKKAKRASKERANRSPIPDAPIEQQSVTESEDGKEDPKKVKEAIEKLSKDMQAVGAKTLGEYFARHVNPEDHRIRKRWTGRLPHYEPEFKAICDKQAQYYPGLVEWQPFREELHHAIFFQRPLKPCGHLVGHCDLEPGRKRALQAIPIAQEFRLLQKVNDLTVLAPDSKVFRSLTPDERTKLIAALSSHGDMKFKAIRKLLEFIETKIEKDTGEVIQFGHVFNLERGGEDKIPGDRTAAKILACDEMAPGIAQSWREMSDLHHEELVTALVGFEKPDGLVQHLQDRFGFSTEQAGELSKVRLEQARCSLSRCALEKLVPLMRKGTSFATAKEKFPEYAAKRIRQSVALDLLPRVLATDEKHVPSRENGRPFFMRARDLRNPAVTRSLAELRKVVNAIIRKYGKPERIHVELAREMKKTPLQREIEWKNNRLRRDDRIAAENAIRMCKEIGISSPREDDKTKWLLAEECNWECPYTGKTITPRTLFSSPQFEVEHIIPRSLSLDNSFENLTLCDVDYNRNIKQKRIPYAVESGNAERWDQILHRVKRFKGRKRAVKNPNRKAKNRVIIENRPNAKAERFAWSPDQVMEFYGDKFTPRQLTDTQYAAKLAMKYLGMLYGGEVDKRGVTDEKGIRRVQPTSGGVTGILRREWGLNAVIPSLPDSPAHTTSDEIRLDEKLRTDHRHHAIDAIVIACTTPRIVRQLSEAAAKIESAEISRQDIRDSQGRHRRHFAEIPLPWGTSKSFTNTIVCELGELKVSRRAERKVQGPLHAATNYSKEINGNTAKYRRQRVPLIALSEKDILSESVIADPCVRDVIRASWKELGGGKPKDVFKNDASHPRMPNSKRKSDKPLGPYIHTVRINIAENPTPVGNASRQRHILPGKNTIHHAVITEESTSKGKRWTIETVSRLEVLRRQKKRLPVIQRDDGFVMWLCKDDCIEMNDDNGIRQVYDVRMISKSKSATDIKIRLHHDARTDEAISKAGERSKYRINSADALRLRGARKVTVSPMGVVCYEGSKIKQRND